MEDAKVCPLSFFLPDWSMRQTASHLFKVKELKDMAPVFLSHGKHVLEKLESVADTGTPIDVSDLFFK